jgi:sulfur carrier protein
VSIRLTVNGKPRTIENGASEIDLPSFLRTFDINPRLVAVAINGYVVPKGEYDAARIRDGDTLEVVRMVGGGAQ